MLLLAGVLPETGREESVCFGFAIAAALGGWLLYRRVVVRSGGRGPRPDPLLEDLPHGQP